MDASGTDGQQDYEDQCGHMVIWHGRMEVYVIFFF